MEFRIDKHGQLRVAIRDDSGILREDLLSLEDTERLRILLAVEVSKPAPSKGLLARGFGG